MQVPGTDLFGVEGRLQLSARLPELPTHSRETVVELIGNTTTSQGLLIQAALDTQSYPTGIKVTDEELATVQLEPALFHGEWNYTIRPRSPSIATVIS